MIPHRQWFGMNLLEAVSCLNANPQPPVPWLISGDDPHSDVFIADYTGIKEELIKTGEKQQQNHINPKSLIVKQVDNNEYSGFRKQI